MASFLSLFCLRFLLIWCNGFLGTGFSLRLVARVSLWLFNKILFCNRFLTDNCFFLSDDGEGSFDDDFDKIGNSVSAFYVCKINRKSVR